MLGAEQLFRTSPRLPGEGKESWDEVGEHVQFLFCELHGVREESLVAGSCDSYRTQQSSTRTRTHRNHQRNDER